MCTLNCNSRFPLGRSLINKARDPHRLLSHPVDTTCNVHVASPHLTAQFWITIFAHWANSFYFLLWTFAHPSVNILHTPSSLFQTLYRSFYFKNRYIFTYFWIYVSYFMILDYAILSSHCVYCRTPEYRDKFLISENLLGNKPFSNSDSDL